MTSAGVTLQNIEDRKSTKGSVDSVRTKAFLYPLGIQNARKISAVVLHSTSVDGVVEVRVTLEGNIVLDESYGHNSTIDVELGGGWSIVGHHKPYRR